MTRNKTQPTTASVLNFLNSIPEEQQKQDAWTIDKILRKITGYKPVMWGASIVGYDTYHYRYQSGREGDYIRIGFSPRKQSLTLYIMPGFDNYSGLLGRLGKHKTSKSCLSIKRLTDIDMDVLTQIANRAWQDMEALYPRQKEGRP